MAHVKGLKIFYIVLVVISALIVGGYCIIAYAIRPPEFDDGDVIDQTASPSPSPSGAADASASPSPTDPGRTRRDEVYTCLIFGMDDGNGNTDTIMVATFDVPNQTIGLVSIPRDTVVRLDKSAGWNKVNTAYAAGGVEQLEAEVEELLGIPIDFYVKIQLVAFQRLVDAVGGVYFDVPVNMHYDDPTQNLHIHVNKGYQLLDGKTAMGVVRFRQSNTDTSFSDVGRVGVQQAFIKAMLSQVMANATLATVPDLVDILLNYVETDAGITDAIYFAKALVGVDLDSAITTATLPSTWHNPYMWVEDEALDTINELLNPYDRDITEDMVEFLKRS